MRISRVLLVLGLLLALAPPAGASDRFIDVVKVSGPLDERAVDFVMETIAEVAPTSEVVILQLDSPAALSGDVALLIELVQQPPVPVVVWVGPEPAIAYGGAFWLWWAAPIKLAAPGVDVGNALPLSFGDSGTEIRNVPVPDELTSAARPASEVLSQGELQPVLLNVVRHLDGMDAVYTDGTRTLATVTVEDGEERPIPTRFHEPGLIDRTLRLTTSPAVAYFFVLGGLAIAAFEFYAAGVGVAAAVAVLMLFLGGYGMAVLPLNWWGVAAAVAGLALYLYDFQRQQLRLASLAGTILLITGGRYFVHEPPQLFMRWWIAAIIVLAIAAFFLFGMTTVVRARFSTPTIGREHLVGRRGQAETDVSPAGVVSVDGARWQATATRASHIKPGDEVLITGVDGVVLEVEPVQ